MITSRARWILSLAASSLVVGVLLRHEGVALASLTLVVWLGIAWSRFCWSTLSARPILVHCVRTVSGVTRGTVTLNVDHDYTVEVAIVTPARISGLRLWIEDTLPQGCKIEREPPAIVVDATRKGRFQWRYTLHPMITGKFVLPGIQVTVADSHGLFRQQRFIPLRQELTVLPFLIRPQTTVSVLKQKNAQLLTGHHRHQRAGVSGELLAIRDYQSGDPPRTIAWKASARLGRLMTCEYESEVPIRSTVIADLSPYQFAARPGPSPADRVVAVTAGIARLLLADRDPVACLLVSESNRMRIPHGSGERQLTRLLHTILSHGAAQFVPENLPIEELLAATWNGCFQQFPELFDERVNPRPVLWRFRRRLQIRQRVQLSFALTQLLRRPSAYAQRLQADDRALRQACRHFIAAHPAAVSIPAAVPDLVSWRRAHHTAVRTVCQGLLECVSRAKDNELFVLAGTFPVDRAEMDQLEQSLRVARAAYHRVLVIDVGHGELEQTVVDPLARRILSETRSQSVVENDNDLQRRLTRLGVKLVHMKSRWLTEDIAAEVELLKLGRGRSSVTSPRTSAI